MKITAKLHRHALALLFALTIGTAPALAQKSAEEKAATPPPSVQATLVPRTPDARPVADKLAPAGWTRYEIAKPSLFSLLLPAKPEASMERMETAPGVFITARTYLSSIDSGVYGTTYVDDLPDAIQNEAAKRAFFEGFVKGFVEGFEKGMQANGVAGQINMAKQRAATGSGLAGYEQDFSFDILTGRVRLVFDGRRAYAVMAFWNQLSTNSERVTFFESLKVNRKH